jgi:ribonuclease R
VEIERYDPRDHRSSGRIVRVLQSAHGRMIGTLESYLRGWRLIPNDDRLPIVDLVTGDLPAQRDAGLIAIVRLTSPPTATRTARGELERVVGRSDDPEVQFLSIAFEFALAVDFPDQVVAEVRDLPVDPDPADFEGREDLRSLPFVTIDGADARDFDDAVCAVREGDGFRAWVAIADVSHYVRPGAELDAEAARRGTSVYFPDRAIPMLPPQLSNQLCSLNPRRDRLVLVAEMSYDGSGRRTGDRFYRAVMHSRARLTYTQVAGALGERTAAALPELASAGVDLAVLRDLMRKLYDNRVADGSLDLDVPEPIVELSDDGRCVGLRLSERNDAHRIIEELMLEANRACARFLEERDVALPYRIHEPPDPAEIEELNEFLVLFGFRVTVQDPMRPQDVQELLRRIRGHRLEGVLSRRLLRSLTQAQYSAFNHGHFGLAFPIYCHFTSPIRRYPDLIVHRQLGKVFDGATAPSAEENDAIEAASIASSQAERNAMDAERAMLDLKRAEFMLGHIGEPQAGTIVSLVSSGFFVELEAYPVEGMVRLRDVEDDFYELIESEGVFQGARTRRIIAVGDRVVVEAVNVSLQRREVEFGLLEHTEDPSAAKRRSSLRSSLPKRGQRRKR